MDVSPKFTLSDFTDQLMAIIDEGDISLSNAGVLQKLLQYDEIRGLFKDAGMDMAQLDRGIAAEITHANSIVQEQQDEENAHDFDRAHDTERRKKTSRIHAERLLGNAKILAASQQRGVTAQDVLKAFVSLTQHYNCHVRILDMMNANVSRMIYPPQHDISDTLNELRQSVYDLTQQVRTYSKSTSGGFLDNPYPDSDDYEINPKPAQNGNKASWSGKIRTETAADNAPESSRWWSRLRSDKRGNRHPNP